MKDKIVPFNPLDKRNLGESVGQAMLRQPVIQMSGLPDFGGAGLYAIYYVGTFPAYLALAERNMNDQFAAPIYVGKAVPKGARKGGELDAPPGNDLQNRLRQHVRSLDEAVNLDLADFYCRYMIVDDIWIPLGESLLIAKFCPIWNTLVDGFGNHDPGRGRHAGLRPRWDVLHPGRSWADKCMQRNETPEQIIREIQNHLSNNPPPDNSLM